MTADARHLRPVPPTSPPQPGLDEARAYRPGDFDRTLADVAATQDVSEAAIRRLIAAASVPDPDATAARRAAASAQVRHVMFALQVVDVEKRAAQAVRVAVDLEQRLARCRELAASWARVAHSHPASTPRTVAGIGRALLDIIDGPDDTDPTPPGGGSTDPVDAA